PLNFYHADVTTFPTRRSSDLRAGVGIHHVNRITLSITIADTADIMVGSAVATAEHQHGHCRVTDLDLSQSRLRPGLTETGKGAGDRKSTRLNSSHVKISYAVF